MSSLQKFHRRTNGETIIYPTVAIGSGNDTKGYCLGASGSYNLYVAPRSTETQFKWGSFNTVRNTTSTTNGLANTNTLAGFGNSITTGHPAAYYCKNLTTGGYNTWYLPAIDELNTCYINKGATPFATANSFVGSYFWSSTENDNRNVWIQFWSSGFKGAYNKSGNYSVRAVRRSII